MDYINKTVAVGVVMMDSNGYDEMVVFNGKIKDNNGKLVLHIPNETPMEMSDKWLEKLKEVDNSMPEKFQNSQYCLIIASANSSKKVN